VSSPTDSPNDPAPSPETPAADSPSIEESAPSDPAELQEQIDATRADLARSVDTLADKMNVKKQASDKVDEVKQRIEAAAAHAKSSAPPQVQHVIDTVTEKAAPVVHRAQPYRREIIAGAVAALVVLLVIRRRSRA
jgi:ElaB/YqjD/DUF883 family membrane-anchored ribosome-binding protein